jgi:DNA-directed RNA polymerase subunit A'
VLISGAIDRNSIGAEKSESLLHRIIKDYGTNDGREFLNKISRLLARFVTLRGLSYSYDELDLTPNARQKIHRTVKHAEKEVDKLTKQLRDGELERLPGQSLDESFEIYVMDELSKAREKAGEVADLDFNMDNAGVIMTRSGARGSTMNIGQMAACLGQQSVRGKRIMRGYLDRALPHFNAGDPSPKARGFVNSSYRDGLDPVEFFFHAMGGREGLVDTAVRTQQSGYMQRRLINAMEHLRVEYDDTVRNSIGDIVQFKYGEDGVDPARSDHGKAVNVSRLVDQIELSVEKGEAASDKFIDEQLENVKDQLTPLLVKELKDTLQRAKLTKEGVKLAVKLTVERYKQALVEPGEAIGIVAAQSIGEPGTQMTLRTFHYAGVKEQNVTIGLPRLIEIVDARREPSTPTMTIFLEKKNTKNLEKAKEVAQRILYTTIQDIAESSYLNPESEGVVVEIDLNKMKDRGITMEMLVESLNVPKYSIKFEGNRIFVESKKPIAVRRLLDHISAHQLLGVSGIKRVLVMEEKGEWVIRTDGSNLTKVLEVPGVDPTRTTTNNVHEISKTLGVEAARNALISEAAGVLEEQGLDVDLRHIMLVSDIMAATGNVRQIGRHGVSGGKSSVLARAAFEITVPNIVDAAVKGQNDLLKGVTENVIVGQSIPIGTGLVEIYMTAAPPEAKEEKPSG